MVTAVDLELELLEEAARAWLDQQAPIARLTCEESGATLRLALPESDSSLVRRFPTHQVDEPGFGRLAALAVGEMLDALRESTREPEITTPGPVEAQPQIQEGPAIVPPHRPFDRWQLGLYGDLWIGGDPTWLEGGGHIALSFSALRWLVVEADLMLLSGNSSVSLGEVRSIMASGALRLAAQVRLSRFLLAAGIGYRLGLVNWKGHPATSASIGRTATIWWSGPMLAAQGSVRFGRIGLGLYIEVGYVVKPARALIDEQAELSHEGIWATFGLGLSTFF